MVTAKFAADTKTNFGYTISGLVSTLETNTVLSVNYYDNYQFIDKYGFPNWTSTNKAGFGKEYTSSAKGLLTGTAVAQLDKANTYQYTLMRYDYKGNIVETKSSNHLGGTESEYLAYHFSGQPKKKQHIHTVTIDSKTTQQQEDYAYTYDHTGRLKKTTHKLNNGSEVVLAENTYDELGRLKATKANSQANLNINYAYNVRSWIRSITNEHFHEYLDYKYNGNINYQTWIQNGKERKYTFGYDQLSRLKSATYAALTSGDDSKYGTSYTYDKHGNVKTANRQGVLPQAKPGDIDKVTFTYTGNQLTKATDAIANISMEASHDFKNYSNAAVQYTYNANGAMTQDLNKGIQGIKYNSLNLPQEMVINHASARAKNYYSYNAAGVKLKTVHKYDPKLQANPVLGSTTGDGSLITQVTKDYVANKIYENGALKKILVDNGYIENGNYYFYVKDHLGNNRIVANATAGVQQTNQYYPFGMMFAESTSPKVQDYKYNGKELDLMHGLNHYDYSARQYDPARLQFTTVDPHAEKYYSWSPYAYVVNNPMLNIDPNGEDYWSTNDPEEIAKFLKALNYFEVSDATLFDISSWIHISDNDFVSGLTYNDETNMFQTSYVSEIPDAEFSNGHGYVVNEVKIAADHYNYKGENNKIGARGLRYPLATGRINPLYLEFDIALAPTRAAITLGKYIWNSITWTPGHTKNVVTNGPRFRGGKQNKRDSDISQYPTDFRRWYHKYYKGNQRGNATKDELSELYSDWLNMGSPKVK